MLSIAARSAAESTAVRLTISGKGEAAAAVTCPAWRNSDDSGAVQNQTKAPLHWSDGSV